MFLVVMVCCLSIRQQAYLQGNEWICIKLLPDSPGILREKRGQPKTNYKVLFLFWFHRRIVYDTKKS